MYGDKLEKKEKWLNYGIVGVGGLCAVSGTWVAMIDLMRVVAERS